ncbi:unnamed protein product [Blepharisma stoltei]|uniref:chitin synthase n=1 Tax=Blepharisma stoltei TaxID=1481888 RepID=A0AAU9KB08_9CILI|nr:unnamed protein product [Blepharisma stoltei]
MDISEPELSSIDLEEVNHSLVIDDGKIVYQPIRLKKVYEESKEGSLKQTKLKTANGLDPISPNDSFKSNILSSLLNKENETKFLIFISMYNEDLSMLEKTLSGIISNFKYLKKVRVEPINLACVVIADGMKAFYSKHKNANNQGENSSQSKSKFFNFEEIKRAFPLAYDDLSNCRFAGQTNDDEFAHTFTQNFVFPENPDEELQLIFCIKQENRRKLNSHFWFLHGFCKMIDPKFVQFLDVGTIPNENALVYLYQALLNDERIAGCCGEIVPIYTGWKNLVVNAQIVEYKFSHTFEKSFESIFGYVSVLPGAFSAYRWEALQGPPIEEDYFKPILKPELMNPYESNVYLAEDRVLCLSLVSKKIAKPQKSYLLRYIRRAIAETDAPDTLGGLISQRRRWINGSWFAVLHFFSSFEKIFLSNHHWFRKFIFFLQLLYFGATTVFQWFLIGSFFLVFAFTVRNIPNSSLNSESDLFTPQNVIIIVYMSILLMTLLTSLGTRPQKIPGLLYTITTIYGIYMIFIMALVIMYLYDHDFFSTWVYILSVLTAATFIINIAINWSFKSILRGIIQYIFLTPTYVNVFLMHAMCNLHDCTWGTRPDNPTEQERENEEDFKIFRTYWLMIWVFTNAGFAYALNFLNKNKKGEGYVYAMAATGFFILLLRFLGGIFYMIQECFYDRKILKFPIKKIQSKDNSAADEEKIMKIETASYGNSFKDHSLSQSSSPILNRSVYYGKALSVGNNSMVADHEQSLDFMLSKSCNDVEEGIGFAAKIRNMKLRQSGIMVDKV